MSESTEPKAQGGSTKGSKAKRACLVGCLAIVVVALVLVAIYSMYYEGIMDFCCPESGFSDAAKNGDVRRIERLLARGVGVDRMDSNYGGTALQVAAREGQREAVEFLIRHGADVNTRGGKGIPWPPLYVAAEAGHFEVAKLLVDNGADLNGRETDRNPLAEAIERGHADIAEMLMGKGAKADLGKLLLSAASGRSVSCVRLLLDRGADVNLRDSRRSTPLHRARNRAVAQFLIEKGAKVNAEDLDRLTPLHGAASDHVTGVVDLLIARGANVNAKDCKGTTPLDHAMRELRLYGWEKQEYRLLKQERKRECEALLLEHGGKSGKDLR